MKSPFPGMDPYIEASGLWEGFHNTLIVNVAQSLSAILPQGYLIHPEERSYILMVDARDETSHKFIPDIAIVKTRPQKRRERDSAVAVLPKPVNLATMVALVEEEHREAFVEIRANEPGQRLITSVEMLSPSNKQPGTLGWDLYQRKRQSCLLGGVNLVEVDLIRDGKRMPMVDPWPHCTYTYLLARAKNNLKCDVWPIQLNQQLPPLTVPLSPRDVDLHLELQPIIDAIYECFRYDQRLDYRKSLSPPLSKKDAAWAASCIRTARKK